MSRTFTLMLLMILLVVVNATSQSIERQVIGSAGTTLSNATVTLDFTIGEPVITTITNGTAIVSQGFHQGSLMLAIKVNPVVFLQGPALNPNSGEESLMRDDLRVASYIPNTSPYIDGLVVDNSILTTTGANAIVDWVFVELRDATTNTTIVDSQSGLLQRDGDIVGVDGVSDLEFDQPAGNYFVAIKHRNHLGMMTSTAISLSSTTTALDFTDGSVTTYGTNAQTTIGTPTGVSAMWAGDANDDSKINLIGSPNDNREITDVILNDPLNIFGLYGFSVAGYTQVDMNLSGDAQIIGTNNDVRLINDNILNNPSNIFGLYGFTITEQLPEVVSSKQMARDKALLAKAKSLTKEQ
ncbi:hemagglutinin protein [Aquimarina sp. 2201CG14-23]|uniref:hemagglutinin protein n=1 Tax=Aquimarina mycalae TaxID=3040073 RepID=UPI0024781120|nr:hemagglutinin protein [Aquimarina sp. 2201CG14-23]MDH7447655.1 hemagglutinin protein [Aquimarina sp. 2201CG14-23]